MPTKPKRPCAYPGCPRLTDGQYCEEHRKTVNRQYNKYARAADVHKKYGRAWKRIRDRYALEHPFCEMCYKAGRMTLMDEVHHIVPVAQGGGDEPENLVTLCKDCHKRRHREQRAKNKEEA